MRVKAKRIKTMTLMSIFFIQKEIRARTFQDRDFYKCKKWNQRGIWPHYTQCTLD